jgi:hypothetical protein
MRQENKYQNTALQKGVAKMRQSEMLFQTRIRSGKDSEAFSQTKRRTRERKRRTTTIPFNKDE